MHLHDSTEYFLFLALKEFKHAALRYGLVTAVIVLVSSLVFILSALGNGLSTGNREALDAIDADGFVLQAGSEFTLDRSRLTTDVLEEVKQTEGIEDAQPFAATSGNARLQDSDALIGSSIIGVPVGSFLDPGASSGESLNDVPDGVVIDQSMQYEGVDIGDTLVFEPSGVELKVVGAIKDHEYRLVPTLYMSSENWAKVQPEAEGTFAMIAVRGEKDAIDQLPSSVSDVMVGSKGDLIDNLPGYQQISLTLLLIQVFLIVIAAGIIAAFFFILTLQKMSELGVMKALGATTATLARALIIQSAILSAIGIFVGVVAASALQLVLAGKVPYDAQWQQMLTYGVILLVVAVGGTLLSLIRIARVDPLDAINQQQ